MTPEASDSRSPRGGAKDPHCPRCGSRLGRLAADDRPAAGGAGTSPGAVPLYCGCCGLVLPAAPPAR